MLTFPNAKINIGLNIIEKRADGFHNLESIFYPVGWKDALEIVPAQDFSFGSTGLKIPGNTDNNLIIRAYHLLKSEIDQKNEISIKVHLHKIIPMGAGLGGGSADGAFALKMFNQIFELGLSNEVLANYARKLGSDCAFFIENKPVFCYEKGDKFEEIALDLRGRYIVLVNPEIHISTAEAYSGVKPAKPKIGVKEAIKQPIAEWKNLIVNDFELHLLPKYPVLATIKNALYELGADYASMTGSGSTVYGIFEKPIHGKETFKDFMVWEGQL